MSESPRYVTSVVLIRVPQVVAKISHEEEEKKVERDQKVARPKRKTTAKR